jgi:hypothetical protein
MLDGFQYALAQIGVVVAITALLGGVLGWLIGHGSRRRTEKAFEQAVAAITRTVPETSPFAPTSTSTDAVDTSRAEPAEDDAPANIAPLPVTAFPPYGATLIDHVPSQEVEDPDATVIRPASIPKTPLYVPRTPVISSVPPAQPTSVSRERTVAPTVSRERTVAPTSASEDVLQLRQELRNRDLELGRLEAGALSAWDRMLPQLQDQIKTLLSENDQLQRRMRAAEEHSDADALTLDHLRAMVAERDLRIAELRAQI